MTRPPPGPNRGSAAHEPGRHTHRSKLREFLAQVAVSLVLEGSTPPEPPPTPARARKAASRSTPLVAFLLVVASGMALVLWWPDPVDLPQDLQGRWVTADQAWTGRELVIRERSIGFRITREDSVQNFPVAARRVTDQGESRVFRIEYDAPEGRFILTLSLSQDGIRLANRSELLWTRKTRE